MASGFTYFRDHDGTLCRRSRSTQHEVWHPADKEWGSYFWDARAVVEITAEEVAAGWGSAALL